jgi:hypothetical protein
MNRKRAAQYCYTSLEQEYAFSDEFIYLNIPNFKARYLYTSFIFYYVSTVEFLYKAIGETFQASGLAIPYVIIV